MEMLEIDIIFTSIPGNISDLQIWIDNVTTPIEYLEDI